MSTSGVKNHSQQTPWVNIHSQSVVNTTAENARVLNLLEWRMFIRALGQSPIAQQQKISFDEKTKHHKLRIAVANFLSSCTDLTTVINECDQCLQLLRKPCANILKWRQRALQRRFLRHLRDKCYYIALRSATQD